MRKRKVINIIKVQNDEHLKQLVREGNTHFFRAFPKCSEDIYIRLSRTVDDKLMWFVYFDATDEQQEFEENESFTGEYSWIKQSIEEGRFYCKNLKL